MFTRSEFHIYVAWWRDKGVHLWREHVLAIFKEPEDYESLKNALANIIKEVENLLSIDINGVSYSIEYYICGDWKFLALITSEYADLM